MIERPRRAITRFFIPLIDVLILFFCIFLLMPFTNAPTQVEEDPSKAFDRPDPTPLPQTVTELQRELERARRELKKYAEGKGDLAQRVAARVLQIDPKSRVVYYYHEGERREIKSEQDARRVIDLIRREAGTREPLIILLRPDNYVGPETGEVDQLNRWFQDVPHQFK